MILNDAIIPFHPKDKATVETCCNSLRDVMEIKRIFLITSENPNIPNTNFINEKEIKNILSVEQIKSYWKNSGGKYFDRAGWIYQQLLEVGTDQIIPDLSEDYLTCDSDIVFLQNPYVNITQTNVFPYARAYTGEYHEDYRKNYETLMGEPTTSGISFINHNMVLNRTYMRELRSFIEAKNGKRWDEAILHSLDLNAWSGFASDDLYGNYMIKYKNYKTINVGAIRVKDIKHIPTQHDITTLRNQGYHILSSQQWQRGY